ncbi:MAG TPA: hypothetical protein VEQ60_02455 [Longimicrobium sp.]|nr:hypothetical protein [Longimicrobium sp.]
MYRSCIFCSAPLGSNDSIERFPVGRSLAFDAEKGRLWAVCPKCARWNLAPLEERWEAIEDAERLFRDTRIRAQRENVGLAKLPDGTRLVRIGAAPAGEMAVWRYGRELRRRRNQMWMATTAKAVEPLALWGGAMLVAPLLFPLVSLRTMLDPQFQQLAGFRQGHRLAYRVSREHSPTGRAIHLRWRELALARTAVDGEGRLTVELLMESPDLPRGREPVVLIGPAAASVAARALVKINGDGARERDVRVVLDEIASMGGTEPFLRELAARRTTLKVPGIVDQHPFGRLLAFRTPPVRARHLRALRADPISNYPIASLALEMALHEETERRALDGELAMLEAMWRDAEQIAAIADRLPDVPAPEPPRLGAES